MVFVLALRSPVEDERSSRFYEVDFSETLEVLVDSENLRQRAIDLLAN